MTPRERVLTVLNKKKADYVPWYGDLSYWIYYLSKSGKLEEKYKGKGEYALYRDLGVGFYLQTGVPVRTVYDGVKVTRKDDGKHIVSTVETPVGTLKEVWQHIPDSYTVGPVEHFVKDWKDLKVLRYWYEHTHYEPEYKFLEERYQDVGDNGIVMCFLPKSPMMDMVALLSGIEAVTYAIMDEPDEFDETMKVMEQKADEAAAIALKSPAECLMIPENLSSEVVGKGLFEMYMRRYEEKWNRKIKGEGKYSFIHMDGTMRGLISEVASTGFSILEALTPSPVGDIKIEELAGWVEPDTVIWGGIPGLYFTDIVSDEEFDRFVIHVLDVMKREPRYVLGVADQVPPGARFERIARVNELVMKHGKY